MILKKLINLIKDTKYGLPLDKYIEICLYDNNYGYYKKNNPIGKKGDFITSPEISQLFGEILGLYIYNFWKKNFQNQFNLIELGPGNGTLVEDILRINRSFKNFNKNLNLKLLEVDKELIRIQKKKLLNKNEVSNKIQWFDKFEKIENKNSIIYANEFFDCLPTKQFIKKNNRWYEKFIDYDNSEKFLYLKDVVLTDNNLIKELNLYGPINDDKNIKIIEISRNREIIFDKICKYIKLNSGIIIIFDYGYNTMPNQSTLQSIQNHKYSNLLSNPGNQDITSLVNFDSFVKIAKKNKMHFCEIYSQREFLINNGIIIRKNKILEKSEKEDSLEIEKALKRLISIDQMGSLFKCLIVSDL